MPAKGYLTVRTYTSSAQIPVVNTAIVVTKRSNDGTRLLALRMTDESGNIEPIAIETPELSESLQPGAVHPWTSVDVLADHPEFERILVENVQIFAGVTTDQQMEMIPNGESPETWNMTEVFDISGQQL